MNELELERALQSWGRHYGERRQSEWDEDGSASMIVGGGTAHPIARAMDFGTRGDKRNPVAYRRPREAVKNWRDPIRATATRPQAGAAIPVEFSRDPLADEVERAVMTLQRFDTALGTVLRFQYCRRGTQAEKAVWMSKRIPVTLRTYRDMLVRARCWMQGRLSA